MLTSSCPLKICFITWAQSSFILTEVYKNSIEDKRQQAIFSDTNFVSFKTVDLQVIKLYRKKILF